MNIPLPIVNLPRTKMTKQVSQLNWHKPTVVPLENYLFVNCDWMCVLTVPGHLKSSSFAHVKSP